MNRDRCRSCGQPAGVCRVQGVCGRVDDPDVTDERPGDLWPFAAPLLARGGMTNHRFDPRTVPPDAVDDWKYEVANGDTFLGLREWLTNTAAPEPTRTEVRS